MRGRRKHTFSSIQYGLTGIVDHHGIQRTPIIAKFIARAFGARSDGQMFFAQVDLPPKWDGTFDWRPKLLGRLNSFLYENCWCGATPSGDLKRTCAWHEKLNSAWHRLDHGISRVSKMSVTVVDTEDEEKLGEPRAKSTGDGIPIPSVADVQSPVGATSTLTPMNRDYPWCKFNILTNHWYCSLCGSSRDAYTNNPSYRNQFVFEHAKCGYENAGRLKFLPPPKEDEVLEAIAAKIEQKMRTPGSNSNFIQLDAARAVILNLRGQVVATPKVSVEEIEIKSDPSYDVEAELGRIARGEVNVGPITAGSAGTEAPNHGRFELHGELDGPVGSVASDLPAENGARSRSREDGEGRIGDQSPESPSGL